MADRSKAMGVKRTEKPVIDVPTHPLRFLERAFGHARNKPDFFQLVSYNVEDGAYGKTDMANREYFDVPAADIVRRGVEIIEASAAKGLDVVVSSKVKTQAGLYHMLLVDFALSDIRTVQNDTSWKDIFDRTMDWPWDSFSLYGSGRSFHGYGPDLVSEEVWRQFNAKLLTLPGCDGEVVPDFRWIGHQLLRGRSALRLSAVDMHYLHEPKLVFDSLENACPF